MGVDARAAVVAEPGELASPHTAVTEAVDVEGVVGGSWVTHSARRAVVVGCPARCTGWAQEGHHEAAVGTCQPPRGLSTTPGDRSKQQADQSRQN